MKTNKKTTEKKPKKRRLWLVRDIGLEDYDIVESESEPWLTDQGGGPWWVTREDGRVARLSEIGRLLPHLKLAPGECCEIRVEEV